MQRADFVVDLLPGGALSVRFPYDAQAVQLVRSVVGRCWYPEQKIWTIPPAGLRYLQEQAGRAGIGVAVGERVQQALNLGVERREALVAAKNDTTPIDLPTSTELYPFQFAGIHFAKYALHNFKGAMLAHEMGCGKSIMALALVALHPKLRQVLVLCPATLKYNWAGEIDQHFPCLTYTVINGNAKQRAAQWQEDTRIKICNYELLLRDMYPRVTEWDLVIADEVGGFIRNYKAERTKRTKKLRRRYSLALAGIPLENRLEELHSVMDFVIPGLLGSGWVFVQQHVVRDDWGRVLGYRGIEEIKQRIAPYYIRRTKAEVLPDLPEKTYSNLPLEMNDAEWRLYEVICVQIADKIEENPKLSVANILTEMLRLKQLTADARLLGECNVPSSKGRALRETLEIARASGHKLVVFTQFAQLAFLLLADLSAQCGMELPIIAGRKEFKGRAQREGLDGFDAKSRTEVVRNFQAGDFPALVSTDAGAYGITLTAADIVWHMDILWNPVRMRQREDRLHRIGQRANVQVVTPACRRTIDEQIKGILHKKLKIIGAVLDEENPEDSAPNIERADLLSMLHAHR